MLNYSINKLNFFFLIVRIFPSLIFFCFFCDMLYLAYITPVAVYYIFYFLKKHTSCLFNLLLDITAIDYIYSKIRFELVYCLLSVSFTCRFFVKVVVSEFLKISSICRVFTNALCFEREVWDMFGILFLNGSMFRILTDYGFKGYPLRKDFPLIGFYDMGFSYFSNSVVHENFLFLIDKHDFFVGEGPWFVMF